MKTFIVYILVLFIAAPATTAPKKKVGFRRVCAVTVAGSATDPRIVIIDDDLRAWLGDVKAIRESMDKGEQEFRTLLERLRTKHPNDPVLRGSLVHDDKVVRGQAFVLVISSANYPEEIVDITFMTFAAHLVDDYVDRDDIITYPLVEIVEQELRTGNAAGFCRLAPNACPIITAMIAKGRDSKRRAAIIRSLWRIVMGALIQRSRTERQMNRWIHHYKREAINQFSRRARTGIWNKISPLLYLTTANTALEEMMALEDQAYNPLLVEVWNLVYGPLLFFHNNRAERKGEEYLSPHLPTEVNLAEVERMLSWAYKQLISIEDERVRGRLKALRHLLDLYRGVIPRRAQSAYLDFLSKMEGWFGFNESRRRRGHSRLRHKRLPR